MNLLVTGGAGFIGSCFIKSIMRSNPSWKIVNIDALTYAGNLNNLKSIAENKNYEFVHGNICDRDLIGDLFDEYGFTAVIHFAAETHVDRSIQDSGIFMHTNVLGTQILLEAAKQYQVHRFLNVSTDEVYGSLALKEPAFKEDSPLKPRSPYAASKTAGDLLALAYFETYDLPVIVSRCSNNYGPHQHIEKFIPQCITNIIKEKEIPIYGTGLNIRDWIHVEDHVEALKILLKHGKTGEVYNIGANCEKTNLEVARFILKEMDTSEQGIRYVEDRLGHDFRYAVWAGKLRNTLGWKPKHEDFEEGLQDTIDWYTDHFTIALKYSQKTSEISFSQG